MNVSLYIKEQKVEAIINSESIRVQLNNDTNDPDAKSTVSTNSLELTIDGAAIVNRYIEDGLTGGYGVFEGLPARLELESNGQIENLIDGYLDLADGQTEFECDKVTVKIVERGANDWFEKRKDSFTYAFLAGLPAGSTGRITSDDYVQVPYVISSVPNTTELAIIAISGFMLAAQARTIAKDLGQIGVEFVGIASAARAVAKTILYVVFLITILIAMIRLLKQIVDLIIQPVKYHAGMRLKTLLEKGAEYLGMDFESSNFNDPFWRDLVIIPEKFQSFDDGTDSGILGFQTPMPTVQTGYYNGTFGDVLGIAQRLWNARVVVLDGVIRMERVDFSTATPNYRIPAVEILSNKLNSDELKALTSIRFATDLSEPNTIDRFEGTFTDVVVTPKAVGNQDMILLSGEERIEIGISQAKEKIQLTGPESFINVVVNVLAPIINLILKLSSKKTRSKIPSGGVSGLVENRKGMIVLDKDFFSVPKCVSLDIRNKPVDTKVKEGNDTRLTSYGIYDEFYFVNSFVPSSKLPEPNQWRKYTRDNIIFCFEDYLKVKNNPRIFDTEGNEGKVISLDWSPEKEVVSIEYWLRQMYTSNLKETINTPDGF